MEMGKGNAPMLAALRIKELDTLVAKLKQNSSNCKKSMKKDETDLYHLEREIHKIKVRYDPLCLQLQGRLERRLELQKQHDQVAKQVSNLLSGAKARLRQSNNQQVRQLRREANEELCAARGYSVSRK